ncbi:prepilin-type N-terminal cleavage/methylation domain-containing protein [Candidatus Peregrinibacteria bacterium]|nr:MAG: prepilin-type N-terminal cleavage/methylation domain-containing protein [Candidatus Peregrinibacteria bacterium]
MKNHFIKKPTGVSLVELMVAVTIMSIIMLSISTFFSGTLKNSFNAQQEADELQGHITANLIILDRFRNVIRLMERGTDYALSLNTKKNALPFSFVGAKTINGNVHVAVKDLLVFNKIWYDGTNYYYLESGTGLVRDAFNNTAQPAMLAPAINPRNITLQNATAFTRAVNGANQTNNYVVHPYFNTLMNCGILGDNCFELPLSSALNSPTDITSDGLNRLFISDSGNGRILEYDILNNQETVLADHLNYPTGIAYYQNGGNEYLFIAETKADKIKKYDFNNAQADGRQLTVIVGNGKNTVCTNTASLCALNTPTGLFLDQSGNTLYIADSGNDRVLRMRDPGPLSNLTIQVTPKKHHPLSAVELINPSMTGGSYNNTVSNLIGFPQHYNSLTKRFENPSTLTLFENATAGCSNGGNQIYVNTADISTTGLQLGHTIMINQTPYTVSGTSIQNCSGTSLSTDNKVRISVQEAVPNGLSAGTPVDFSHPAINNPLVIQIDNPTITQAGFLTTEVNLYDVNRQLVETLFHRIRVGDGELGTPEDTIEIIAANNPGRNDAFVTAANGAVTTLNSPISFPTGVSNAYFINSGRQEVVRLINANAIPMDAINPGALPAFDFVSEYAVNSIKMAIYAANGQANRLLEMVIDAPIGNRSLIHHLNAVLP